MIASSTTCATDGAHLSRCHNPDADNCKHVYHKHALKGGEIGSQGVMDKARQPGSESSSNSGGCLNDADCRRTNAVDIFWKSQVLRGG